MYLVLFDAHLWLPGSAIYISVGVFLIVKGRLCIFFPEDKQVV